MSEEVLITDPRNGREHTWNEISEEIIAGIGHDLNDRLYSLFGLVQLGELDQSIDSALSKSLMRELSRVQELVELLRLLSRPIAEEPEPIRLTDLLPTLQSLVEKHRGVDAIDLVIVKGADPLVSGLWTEVFRELMIAVIALTSKKANAKGGRISLEIREAGDQAVVIVSGGEESREVRFDLIERSR